MKRPKIAMYSSLGMLLKTPKSSERRPKLPQRRPRKLGKQRKLPRNLGPSE